MSNIAEVSVTSTVERKVQFLPIIEGALYAYKDERHVNGGLAKSEEGLTGRSLKSIQLDTEIVHAKEDMYRSSLAELHRTTLLWHGDRKPFSTNLIHKPFTYLVENEQDTSAVCFLRARDGDMYDEFGNRLPKAVHLDFMSAGLDDGNYDLEESVNVLKKRQDILWKEEGITRIPAYMGETDRDYYLDIVWIPSEEDWNKVKKYNLTFDLCRAILTDVIGLVPKPTPDEEMF